MPNETALADDGASCIELAASECATSSHLKVRLFQTRVKLRAAVELALKIGTGAACVFETIPSRDVDRELFAELLAEEEAEEEAEEVKAEEEEEEDASVLMLPRMG